MISALFTIPASGVPASFIIYTPTFCVTFIVPDASVELFIFPSRFIPVDAFFRYTPTDFSPSSISEPAVVSTLSISLLVKFG